MSCCPWWLVLLLFAFLPYKVVGYPVVVFAHFSPSFVLMHAPYPSLHYPTLSTLHKALSIVVVAVAVAVAAQVSGLFNVSFIYIFKKDLQLQRLYILSGLCIVLLVLSWLLCFHYLTLVYSFPVATCIASYNRQTAL